jgi:ribose/xylose/arabinose/galactoside ABC-type transport system permease subunit
MSYKLSLQFAFGGTSVFDWRGTLFGTLFRLCFVRITENGMHLLALPSKFTGGLTGLLLGIVSLGRLRKRLARLTPAT